MKDLKELSNQCKRMACLVILLLVTLLLISAEAWAGKPGQGMTHPEGRLASPVSTEAANGNAQQALTVTGRVTDITGAPLPGVTVLVKNTVQGTITGSDGSYTLSNVPGNSTLMFSFVGMKTIEVAVAGKRVLNVTMEEETIDIEEVVAIGYGSLSKKEISSSIVNVNKENFNKGAVSDPMELIIGKVAGLNIDESSASPHSTSNYQIRGGYLHYGRQLTAGGNRWYCRRKS